MNEEIKKKGEKERKKEKGKRKKGRKKKNLAQLSCCCLPPRVTWCSGLVLSFHSHPLLPAGGWNREILSREQRTQSRRLQYFLQEGGEEKKKKSCFNPCCKQSSDSLCWLSWIAKRFFAAKLLPLELNPGNSNAAGGFCSLPSIHSAGEQAAFFACQVAR